ncbi:GNAT family N-acetyltransferase [Halopseudomonas bauzanensis]|uniref:GNAT family N-acetyltransferase n=1 Tax=Halopseudomonas bauzanensis TaxID=653930 RepID=UPI0035265D20
MLIRDAVVDDVNCIVNVHVQAFEGFFLTQLGPGFVAELYKAFATRPAGILRIICDEEGNVLGFAGGTIDPEAFYRGLRKEKSIIFLVKMLPGLMRHPLLFFKKLWYALFYTGEKPSSLDDSALLSSIAVIPGMAGKSLGKKLLEDFEREVKKRGLRSLFLTTDKYGNDKVVGFYLRSGYSIESEFKQADGREMLRFVKIFDGEKNE